MRLGPGERLEDCAEDPLESGNAAAAANPCWRDVWIIEAFDEAGRYLGEVENFRFVLPATANVRVRGDMVVAAVADDAGTIMVKRYRLVLPGER